MPFAENIIEFFDTDDFAETVTISGGIGSVNVIFTDEYAEQFETEGDLPMAVARTTDVAAVTHGMTVTRGATTFTVREIQPDGTGVTVLVLEEN